MGCFKVVKIRVLCPLLLVVYARMEGLFVNVNEGVKSLLTIWDCGLIVAALLLQHENP